MNESGVVRGRRGTAEAVRDWEWLRWIGRFRFVTARLLAARFGVSEQQANARVRRLAAAGLVLRTSGGVGQAHAVVLTRKGARHVGLPERREARTDAQREHESAIIRLVGVLERRLAKEPGLTVLTERECRERRALGLGRYSVEVFRRGHELGEKRWPDVVVEGRGRKAAYELEFAPKAAERLRAILRAYASSDYSEVRFLATSPAVARLIARNADVAKERRTDGPRLGVAPWWGAGEDVQRAVAAAIAEPGAPTQADWRS
jgi:hypothetical protein